jgi:hypothetical protein
MRYIVSVITGKGWSMGGVNNKPLRESQPAPIAHRGAISTRTWLLGTLLLLIAISAIAGIIVAAASGQTNVALIIALFTGAILSRIAC